MMEMGAELIRMLLDPRFFHDSLAWLADLLAGISHGMAAALLTALWQGLAIAGFLGLCLQFAPRVSAGLRFLVMAAGFAVVVALPFLPALLRIMAHAASAAGGQGAIGGVAVAARPWLVMDARWSLALTLLWIGASLWRAVDLAAHTVRLRRLWMGATPVQETTVVLPKLAGRKAVELCTTEELERPSVIGFLAPRILIPSWLLERMSEAELGQIVLHESEHLRRGDDWTNLLQKLSLVVFPLNPALVWMERRLCLEREMACDEGVVRRTRAPRAYAACLTSLAEHGLERRVQALTLGAWQRRSELAKRVHSLLARKPALRPAAASGLALVLGCGLLAGSAELARCPQIIGFAAPAVTARAHAVEGVSEKPALVAGAALEGDRVLDPAMQTPWTTDGGEHIHATETRALMPMRTGRVIQQHATKQGVERSVHGSDSQDSQRAANSLPSVFAASPSGPAQRIEAREIPTGLSDAQAAQNGESQQGWVVMTAMWEQTETAPSPVVSDTASDDGGAASARDSQAVHAAQADQDIRGASQVTVTRLVWRVVPAKVETRADGGAKVKSSAATEKKEPMPAIVPVRGGWLIFRL